jgi:alpha-ketoglutaric semialdehyde dehydrogenase
MTTIIDTVAINSAEEPATYGLFIGGSTRAGSGAPLELTSRLDGSSLGTVASASPTDVESAFERASTAQSAWAAQTAADRAAIFQQAAALFRQRSGEIAPIIAAEMGKPLSEAVSEVQKGAAIFEYFAQMAYRPSGQTFTTDTGEDVFTVAEPLGVVVLITPWNFPFTIPVRKIAAALATGNAALYKPATNGALCGLAIAQTLSDAGLPDDVLNVIIAKSSAIQDALFQNPALAAVSLTGSYPTAAAIRRALPVEIPFQAELGGKNSLVIWRDADLDFAVQVIWQSSFRNNGQICTSCGRLLVHEDIADRLLERLRSRVDASPNNIDGDEFGILSSTTEESQVLDAIQQANASEILRPDWGDGRVGPTVLVRPSANAAIEEEIFGPVITFETVATIDDAIALANRPAYGLTAGIVTNELDVAKQFWHGVHAGTVKINASLTGTPFHVPLRGWGQSGAGAGEGGEVSMEFFTRRKAVYLRRSPV